MYKGTTTQAAPRIRFNWGYHNGAADGAKPLRNHYDAVYCAGYQAGQVDRNNGDYDSQTATSDAAWRRHISPEQKQTRRMAKYR